MNLSYLEQVLEPETKIELYHGSILPDNCFFTGALNILQLNKKYNSGNNLNLCIIKKISINDNKLLILLSRRMVDSITKIIREVTKKEMEQFVKERMV